MTPIQALAEAAEAAADPTAIDLAQYGAIGTLCALLVAFAFRAWKRETERADRLEAENGRLHGDIQEKAIPALLASATALTEVTELLRDQQRARRYDHDARPPRRDGDQ